MTGLTQLRARLDAFDAVGPNGSNNSRDSLHDKRRAFFEAQEAGRVVMLDGGGRVAAALIVETDGGRLVRIELTMGQRARLAAQLIAMEAS